MKNKRSFKQIAIIIKKYREESGLSQSDVSSLIDYKNGQFISNIERHICSIPVKKISIVSQVLKIPVAELIDAMVEDYKQTLINASDHHEDKTNL